MVTVRVLDHVKQASSYDDGKVIFDLISKPIEEGSDVSLSFAGVLAVPSAFVNASVVRLLDKVPVEELRHHLRIIESTRAINELIRERINFVAGKAESQ